MRMEYKTYEEVKKNFTPGERWQVFDGDRNNFNIARECIDRHPKEKIAVRIKFDSGRRAVYTFDELSRLTSQFAHMLQRLGVKAGDCLALVADPSLEFYTGFFGTLKAGAVVVPCSPLFGPEAIEYRVTKSNAKLMLINREMVSLVRPGLVPRLITTEELRDLIQSEDEEYQCHTSAESLAVMQFSSGTTGVPKAVPYQHIAATFTAVHVKFGVGLRVEDSYYCPSSPAWGHGIWYGTVGPLLFGNAIGAYSGKFSPERLLEALEEFEITNLFAAPLVYRRLMTCGKIAEYKLKLRRLTYTGGAIDMDTLAYFQNKLGFTIQSCYGSTEVGVIIIDYAFDDWKVKPGSLGKPMPGAKVAVIDEKGSELPPGQIGQVAVWRKGGWIRIGDAAYIDEDGYFWHKGRMDDVIKSGGYTIGAIEVEDVLSKHPAVQKVAVVASPDKERGDIVKAFIVTDHEPTEELKREIQDFIKTRLSKHEYPREIEFVSELPETPDGKIKRKELRERERLKKVGGTI